MSGWQGFTDDELNRINSGRGDGDGPEKLERQLSGGRKASGKPSKLSAESAQRSTLAKKQYILGSGRVPTSQKLDSAALPPSEQCLGVPKTSDRATKVNNGVTISEMDKRETSTQVNQNIKLIREKASGVASDVASNNESVSALKADDEETCLKEIDEKEVLSLNMSKLDAARVRQKLMEEENIRRRKVLAEAIANRKKQTQAEQARLIKIQKELDKLDQMIFSDVNVLRDKIEDASRQYVDAQRRYEKAEKEFIDAKLDLHHKTEIKEELTEHLYAIIQENEVRKSKKLSELSGLLEMPSSAATDVSVESDELSKDNLATQLVMLNAMNTQAIRTPRVEDMKKLTSRDEEIPKTEPNSTERNSASPSQEKPQPADTTQPAHKTDKEELTQTGESETHKTSGHETGNAAPANT